MSTATGCPAGSGRTAKATPWGRSTEDAPTTPPKNFSRLVTLGNTDYATVGGFWHGDDRGNGDGSSSKSETDSGNASGDHVTLGVVVGGWAHDPPGRLPCPVGLSNTNYAAIDEFCYLHDGGKAGACDLLWDVMGMSSADRAVDTD